MKANELSCKDLMVGDWVRIKITQHNTKVTNIDVNSVYTEAAFPIRYDEIESIPLTPEILEKNGFEKVYDKYKLPNYRIKWNSYTDLYFTVFTGVDGYWNPISLNVITGGLPATVDYVHQLQHALRLCGIGKEIVL